MAVYRFRVALEDNEEVYREIEIKSTQTYEDFHNFILQSINFDNTHNASFFISDDMWRKGEEITLRTQETNETNRKGTEIAVRQMSKCKIAALIDDPHQKFVYVYDPKTGWTFTVELLKILSDNDKIKYPVCTKNVGEAPKQYKKINGIPVVVEDDEIDNEPSSDDEAYINAKNDDDISDLEGEEGEEVAVEEEKGLVETDEEEENRTEDEYGFSEFENGGIDGGDDD